MFLRTRKVSEEYRVLRHCVELGIDVGECLGCLGVEEFGLPATCLCAIAALERGAGGFVVVGNRRISVNVSAILNSIVAVAPLSDFGE